MCNFKLFCGIVVIFILGLVLTACNDQERVTDQSFDAAQPSPSQIGSPTVVIANPAKTNVNPLPTATLPVAPSQDIGTTPTAPLPTVTTLPTTVATTNAAPTNTVAPTQTAAPTQTSIVRSATATPLATNKPVPTKGATTPTPAPTATVVSSNEPTSVPVKGITMVNGQIVRGKTGKKEVAITLDAGSTAVAFPKQLATLDKYGIKITFFLTGQWVHDNPQFAEQIAEDSMEIANHTYSHPDLSKLSDSKVMQEVDLGASTIESVTGVNPKPLFRFPFGAYTPHELNLLSKEGYRSIYWTYDSLDLVGTPKTAQFLISRVTGYSDSQLDGAIILMHVGNPTSGDALGPIIENLQSRGFKIVTVSELLK